LTRGIKKYNFEDGFSIEELALVDEETTLEAKPCFLWQVDHKKGHIELWFSKQVASFLDEAMVLNKREDIKEIIQRPIMSHFGIKMLAIVMTEEAQACLPLGYKEDEALTRRLNRAFDAIHFDVFTMEEKDTEEEVVEDELAMEEDIIGLV
ncbi:hypothetical protein ACJX0J_020113, partial [Zea mays]